MHLDPPILIIGGAIAVVLVFAFISEKGKEVSPRIIRDPLPDTHEDDENESDEPMEVVVVGLRLSINDVFRLSLQFIVVQILFGVITVLALSVFGVI